MMKYKLSRAVYMIEPDYVVTDASLNEIKIDLKHIIIKKEIREKNIQRERDTRKGIWRY